MMVETGRTASVRPDDATGRGSWPPPEAPEAGVPGIEVLSLSELHRRDTDGSLRRFHRVDFHTLTQITGGSGELVVDFVGHPCRPGTLLWMRPGQVRRLDLSPAAGGPEGVHVLFTPGFPPASGGVGRLLADWTGPVGWELETAGDEWAALTGLVSVLAAEYARPPGAASPEILRLLLGALLLHVDRLPPPGGPGRRRGGEVYARFRAELERRYASTRRAEDYAARLGYSVKTLARACRAATGQSVKHVIDARVALQAQRLLACTDEPVAAIARRLGFSEPTNFVKFFARHTGMPPGDFRRLHRNTPPPSSS